MTRMAAGRLLTGHLSQVFGLLPVSRPCDPRHASFSWTSPRTIFAVVIILAAVTECVLSLARMFETGVKYYTSGESLDRALSPRTKLTTSSECGSLAEASRSKL